MADSVTLALEGNPTLGDLTSALAGLNDLLAGLSRAVAPGVAITWSVAALDVSSAVSTFRGQSERPGAVADVTDAYLHVGRRMQRGEQLGYTQDIIDAAKKIVAVIEDLTTEGVRFETADDDVTITGPVGIAQAAALRPVASTFGAVQGRVQTLRSRGGLRFTLYDSVHNKAVSCYLEADKHDLMRDAWDQLALVRGLVKREPETGRPISIRRISEIELRPESQPDAWRRARGIWSLDGDKPEAVVRRLRDAQ